MGSLTPHHHRTLTESSVPRTLWSFAVPSFWALLTIHAFILIDSLVVAMLGPTPLAALSFTIPFTLGFAALAQGLGIATTVQVARAVGQNKARRASYVTAAAIALSILSLGIAALLCWIAVPPLFRLLGADAALQPLIRDYLAIWLPGGWCLGVMIVAHGAFRGFGNSRTPGFIISGTALLNIVLSPLLTLGLAGFPRMGIEGAALATALSQLLGVTLALPLLSRHTSWLRFARQSRRYWRGYWVESLRLALPVAANQIIIPITALAAIALISPYGEAAIAGFGLAQRIESFALLPFMALAASLPPFVGQNAGAGHHHRIEEAIRYSWRFCLLGGLLVAVLLYIAMPYFVHHIIGCSKTAAIATQYIRIIPWTYASVGLFMAVCSVFSGYSAPREATRLTLLRGFLFSIPLLYLGRHIAGIEGMFWALAAANLLAGLTAWLYLKHKHPGTHHKHPAEPIAPIPVNY